MRKCDIVGKDIGLDFEEEFGTTQNPKNTNAIMLLVPHLKVYCRACST